MLIHSIVLLFVVECNARFHFNLTRTTLSGLASYRSSLTLNWLAEEDERQRAMADNHGEPPLTRCYDHPSLSPRKVGRYMLEMLRKLEGENGQVMKELITTLIRSKILVGVSNYESEPDLESLVKTPQVLRAEPHTTFPRVMALVWLAVTEPENVKGNGWCSIEKVNEFLKTVEPSEVVGHLRSLNIVMGKARLVMENFIQHFSAMNINYYQSMKPVKFTQKMLLRKGTNELTLTTMKDTPSTTEVSATEVTMTFPPIPVRYETLMHCTSNKVDAMPVFVIVYSILLLLFDEYYIVIVQ